MNLAAGSKPKLGTGRDRWLAALRRIAAHRPVILGYHGVGACARRDDPFLLSVAPHKFRAQLEAMLAAGFRFVTVAELVAAAAGGRPPPGLAAVSFDDAMRSALTNALPILSELGIPASMYVPTGWLGGQSPWVAGEAGAILRADELRTLADAGWELGGHSLTHPDLSQLDYDACRREVDGSCEVVRELAGRPVETFAYPYGRYGDAAKAAVADAGLRAALTTGSGSWEPLALTRAMIGAADPFPVVLMKMTDRYEPLMRLPLLHLARRASRQLRHRYADRGTRYEVPRP